MNRPVVWRKSPYSGPSGCVEVAFVNGLVAVRHSKQKEGPILTFTPKEWETFLLGVGDGEFKLPAELVDDP